MILNSLNVFYKKHARWIPIVSFLLGFLFDIAVLKRVDELSVIIQQAIYLMISASFIGFELVEHLGVEIHPPKLFLKVWKYREFLLHFLLGTLLNSYAIFYFKSASALTSFLFIAILIAVLMVNEFLRFGKSQTQVHVALLSLCLISYFVSLAPIVLGFIGIVPFLSAMVVSIIVFYGYTQILKPKLVSHPKLLKTHLFYPFLAIQITFVILYFTHVIPPVPLSVKYMGIFHGAEKKDSGYELSFINSDWKFWDLGDKNFLARPGDVIYCYVQIFSPARFSDQLQVRWLYSDARKGWMSSDAIRLPVTGGREEGYRIVTRKSNYQPGSWRVQIETLDNHEIGRINFKVVSDETTSEREIQTLFKE